MIYEFVDSFKNIRIGSKITILGKYFRIVPNAFFEYLSFNRNIFTVRTIQEIDDDNAMICVEEVQGVLEYAQINPYFDPRGIIRVVNC